MISRPAYLLAQNGSAPIRISEGLTLHKSFVVRLMCLLERCTFPFYSTAHKYVRYNLGDEIEPQASGLIKHFEINVPILNLGNSGWSFLTCRSTSFKCHTVFI